MTGVLRLLLDVREVARAHLETSGDDSRPSLQAIAVVADVSAEVGLKAKSGRLMLKTLVRLHEAQSGIVDRLRVTRLE